jgi:hypothetical protein
MSDDDPELAREVIEVMRTLHMMHHGAHVFATDADGPWVSIRALDPSGALLDEHWLAT